MSMLSLQSSAGPTIALSSGAGAITTLGGLNAFTLNTIAGNSIVFQQSGIERLRIASGGSIGNVGVGTTSPAAALSVSGNGYLTGGLGVGLVNTTAGTLQTTGNATIGGCVNYNGGTSGTCLSDERVKQDITPFNDGLQDIVGLAPVTYEYNGLAGTPNDGDVRTGLIAQQVQQVAPDLVSTTSAFLNASDTAPTQLLEVNYSALTFTLSSVPTLIEEIQLVG
jgi:hypothetical protein